MLANLVRQKVSVVSSDTLSLGSSIGGYVPVAFVFTTGEVIHYSIEDGYNREIGIGTYNSNGTILRTQVLETLYNGGFNRLPTSGISLSTNAVLGVVATVEGLTTVKDVWNNLLGVLQQVPNTGYLSPDYIPFVGGVVCPAFDSDVVESLPVSFQLGHDVKVGSGLIPYINWSTLDNNIGNVRWGLEYVIATRATGVFSSTLTAYFTQSASGASSTNQFIEHPTLTIPAVSQDALIIGRVFRDATHIDDTYTGDAILLGTGMHYLTDKIGTPSKDPDYTVWSD